MAKLFKNPTVGQAVILVRRDGSTEQRIVHVSKRAIKVSSCNLIKFCRDGLPRKAHNRNGLLIMSIKPADDV
jgi:hypothetical protein